MDKEDIVFLLVLFVVCVSLIVQCYYPGPSLTERTRVFYDCRISEISPDVPPLVKERCRKMRKEAE